MRPTFFHASLATALAAMSAPGIAGEEVYFKMTLTDASIATYPPSAGKGEQIDVLSFSWGPRQSTSAIELEPVRITSYQISGAGDSAGGGAVGANQTMTVGGGRIEGLIGKPIGNMAAEGNEDSGKPNKMQTLRARPVADIDKAPDPAEKRQHGWTTLSKPLPQGSVRVKVKMPWRACRVGATYPRLELGGGGKRYVLQDVTVASCGRSSGDADDRPTEEVAFYYNKVG